MGCNLDMKSGEVRELSMTGGPGTPNDEVVWLSLLMRVKHVRAGFFPQWQEHAAKPPGAGLFPWVEYWSYEIEGPAKSSLSRKRAENVHRFDAPLHYNFLRSQPKAGNDYDLQHHLRQLPW